MRGSDGFADFFPALQARGVDDALHAAHAGDIGEDVLFPSLEEAGAPFARREDDVAAAVGIFVNRGVGQGPFTEAARGDEQTATVGDGGGEACPTPAQEPRAEEHAESDGDKGEQKQAEDAFDRGGHA